MWHNVSSGPRISAGHPASAVRGCSTSVKRSEQQAIPHTVSREQQVYLDNVCPSYGSGLTASEWFAVVPFHLSNRNHRRCTARNLGNSHWKLMLALSSPSSRLSEFGQRVERRAASTSCSRRIDEGAATAHVQERACKATRSQFRAHCLSHGESPKGCTVTSQPPTSGQSR